MKKVIKRVLISIAILLVIVLLLFALVFWLFHVREYHIKTEYGDSFTVIGGGFTADYSMYDDNSDHVAELEHYHKRYLVPVCDSDHFRCYRYQNESDDFYVFKIDKYDTFYTIYANDEYTEHMLGGSEGKNIKSEFLCDSHLMEIVLPYFDKLYHDEIIAVAEKLIAGDHEALSEYGLTENMINDKGSLDEKIRIMTDYLDESDRK